MTTVSQTIIANRAAKRDAEMSRRANKITAATYCNAGSTIEYITDTAGRTVRVTPAEKADIRALLVGNRVVDTIDVLEQVGETAFNTLVANGALIRSKDFNRFSKVNLYWVTERARDLYELPSRIRLSDDCHIDYRKA